MEQTSPAPCGVFILHAVVDEALHNSEGRLGPGAPGGNKVSNKETSKEAQAEASPNILLCLVSRLPPQLNKSPQVQHVVHEDHRFP